MGISYRFLLSLITVLTVGAPPVRAQVMTDGMLAGVLPGDSVRVWARSPEPLSVMRARILWHGADSLALSTGTVLPLARISQLQVRRVTGERSVGRAIIGGILGFGAGAVVGGLIGAAATGAFDGHHEYGDGMGVVVGVPVGAALGMVFGGTVGARKQPRERWVDASPVPLEARDR